MASYTINITTVFNSEFNTYNLTLNPSTENIVQGDTVYFKWLNHIGGNQPSSITLSGMDGNVWLTPSGTLTGVGAQITRSTKANATIGTDQIVVSAGGSYPSKTLSIVVSSSVDTVPDQFYLGANVGGVNPSQTVQGAVFIVSGLSAGANAPVSITGGHWTKNGVNQSTNNGTANNGDQIQTFIVAPSTYNSNKTCTLNIGGVTDSWTVTTRADPGDGELIPIGVTSGNIELGLIGDLFGRTDAFAPYDTNLGDYYRGGANVPVIPQTASIPASGDIELGDFYGTSTSLYFEKLPSFKGAAANSQGSGGIMTLNWSTMEAIITSSDFYVGYGENLRNVCEYSYTKTGTATMSQGSSTWSTANRQVALEVSYNQGAPEQEITGTVTFRVRHKLFPSVVLTTTANYRFFIYGN